MVEYKCNKEGEIKMKKCTLTKINTTIGEKYLIVTNCRSKEFKTEKGALKFITSNGYKIVKNLD